MTRSIKLNHYIFLDLTIHNIELQLADKKYPDKVIDNVIIEINKLRRSEKRKSGLQKIIFGSTIISVSMIVTYLSFNSSSPIGIFMSGTAIAGIFLTVKGVWDFIGMQ
jgi:hypothetical protein